MSSIAHPLIFVRHGETDWNAIARYQGTTDTQLSPKGKTQAQLNGEEISRQEGASFSIVTSPLQRARATADIISRTLENQQNITVEPAFRELSIGRWEGLNSQEVKEQFYEERKTRKLDRWNFKPQGGESMAERADIISAALGALKPNSIIITHSVVLRIILHMLGGIEKEEAAQAIIPHVGLILWDGALLHRQETIQ
ncbi:MAG: histidine phosphatase family protein [Rhizobiaceae bacterium]